MVFICETLSGNTPSPGGPCLDLKTSRDRLFGPWDRSLQSQWPEIGTNPIRDIDSWEVRTPRARATKQYRCYFWFFSVFLSRDNCPLLSWLSNSHPHPSPVRRQL